MSDDFPNSREQALLRLVRTAVPSTEDVELPSDEVLWAYISGTADEAQSAEVHLALSRSPTLRGHLFELMALFERGSTPEERVAFVGVDPPPLDRDPRLRAIYRSLERREPRRPRSRWLPWALGGWAAAATAACAIMIAVIQQPAPLTVPPNQPQPPPGTTVNPSPPPSGTPAAGTFGIQLDLVRPLELTGTWRSVGQAQVPEVLVSEQTRLIELTAEMTLDVEPNAMVRLWALAPDGRIVLDQTHRASDLFGRPILRLSSGAPFAPGRYLLRFTGSVAGVVETIEYAFLVRV